MIWCDWGSTRLRAYLLDGAGHVLDRRASDDGAMVVQDRAFSQVLERTIGDWRSDGARVLLSGMIGARGGWVEAPYLRLPVSAGDLVRGIVPVPGEARLGIVPGLAQDEPIGAPDVIRGEELQVMAALAALPESERPTLFCLPGTHSKWVQVEDGRIAGFRTHLTGELYALLCRHSIVGRLMPPEDSPDDEAWFEHGLADSSGAGGIAHLVFTVRARTLLGRLPPEGMRPYLSGLLIGTEIREETEGGALPRRVGLIGEPALLLRYRTILAARGIEASLIDPATVARGVVRVASTWDPRS